MDKQCTSCGGFCKKSGCERQNVQPEQKPVAVYQFRVQGCSDWYDGYPDYSDGKEAYETRTLYTTPPQRTWVGLTLDERSDCYEESDGNLSRFAKAIEAKLKQKNGYAEEKNT